MLPKVLPTRNIPVMRLEQNNNFFLVYPSGIL